MRVTDGVLVLSASDLAKHLSCAHATELDRGVAERRIDPPPLYHDPTLEMLKARGIEHEIAFGAHLRQQYPDAEVLELGEFEADGAERTLDAMRRGVHVIMQATLRSGCWYGRADFLVRVDVPSDLGDWSYTLIDTKLAQETRGATILQLCLYASLLGRLQGVEPEFMEVVKPGPGFPRERFRFAEFAAYYRLVRDRLEATVEAAPSGGTYPEPVNYCDYCRWWQGCKQRRRDDDHLCLVAGIGRVHIAELQRQGVTTLEQLGSSATPLTEKPKRGTEEAFGRIHAQASIQLEGRRLEQPVYELLPTEQGRGLLRLPEPSPGDVFFDIEGDPLVEVPGGTTSGEAGGLEYLLGVAHPDGHGGLRYDAWWALDHDEEKVAFERFIDFVMQRWAEHPGMHVYHFAPYEPSAVKRLMGRHATREGEVDRLLRGGRFIDLYGVTRQSLRASVERYSLKDLEAFHGFEREVELRSASAALRRVGYLLQTSAPGEVQPGDRADVEVYNRDDCVSTSSLRDWLEGRREELLATGVAVPRPELGDGDPSEGSEERSAEVQEVFDALVLGLPADRALWTDQDHARWLLAHQLEYYRREEKCMWWEFFRLHELDHEALLDERKAITGLRFIRETDEGTAKCPVHRYAFPPQEAAIDAKGILHEVGGEEVGVVTGIDQTRRTIDIKKRSAAAAVHPGAVQVLEKVPSGKLAKAVLELARSVAADGVDGSGRFRAARDLLLRRPPRLRAGADPKLRRERESVVDAATRVALDLDRGVLPIQGPPGTGKSYTGSRMIARLVEAGYRVGVTAISHRVIRGLLAKTVEAGAQLGVPLRAGHKGSIEARDGVETLSNDDALAAVNQGCVVGATAWLWAREDAIESLDYLFIDEAGQMALVHALAASRAARNLVLLGDPQQLEQPQQGSHPEGAEVAALQHLLGGHDTMPPEQGLFLDETWRLHPGLCEFTSELYYEGRLRARPELKRQRLHNAGPLDDGQIFYMPVEHTGNQNRSTEEVDAIERLVMRLLGGGVTWTDRDGRTRDLGNDDVLIVAPYNMQVAALSDRLQGLRVGTVDKFQGQEAPVVIYSMASSSAADAPRGMSFLYSPNRLNVATSRAQCCCVLVASPPVLEPECESARQMRWANGLCRFREMATEVAPG